MESDGYTEELRRLVDAKDFRKVRDLLSELPPATVADLLDAMPVEDRVVVFRVLPRDLATGIFEFLPVDSQKELLGSLGSRRTAVLLNGMSADDRTALLEEIPAAAAKQLVMLLDGDQRAIALSLLGYPESSVGRLMTPDYVTVRPEWTVAAVLGHLRENGGESDSLEVLYVLDDAGRLLAELMLRDLILAPEDQVVAGLVSEGFVALSAADDQETAVQLFTKHGRPALPVVGTGGLLIGIVTFDDVLGVAEAEATEDIQKLGGSEALDEPYLKAPFAALVRSRASWLVVLFLGELLTASAMARFEDEIAKAVVLALFVPLIISSGGNAGSQAATLVIRALSIREISSSDWSKVFKREVCTGLLLGTVLGVLGFSRVYLWSFFFDTYGPHSHLVGAVVAVSLLSVVLWGTISGAMLPFVLKGVGADPATSSAPFVATVVDVMGLVIYFTVASFLLSGTLL